MIQYQQSRQCLHTWLQIAQKSQLQNRDLDLTSMLGSSWESGSFSTTDVLVVVAATDSNGSLVCTTTIVAPTTSANQDWRQMGGAATMLFGRTRTQEQQRRILQVLLVSFYLPESSISFTSTWWNASHRFLQRYILPDFSWFKKQQQKQQQGINTVVQTLTRAKKSYDVAAKEMLQAAGQDGR